MFRSLGALWVASGPSIPGLRTAAFSEADAQPRGADRLPTGQGRHLLHFLRAAMLCERRIKRIN